MDPHTSKKAGMQASRSGDVADGKWTALCCAALCFVALNSIFFSISCAERESCRSVRVSDYLLELVSRFSAKYQTIIPCVHRRHTPVVHGCEMAEMCGGLLSLRTCMICFGAFPNVSSAPMLVSAHFVGGVKLL